MADTRALGASSSNNFLMLNAVFESLVLPNLTACLLNRSCSSLVRFCQALEKKEITQVSIAPATGKIKRKLYTFFPSLSSGFH
mgnify:CR=1 FL=1